MMCDLDWMSVDTERRVLFWMSCGMIVGALVMFAVLLTRPASWSWRDTFTLKVPRWLYDYFSLGVFNMH